MLYLILTVLMKRNAMVPLTTLSALDCARAYVNGVTWSKSHVAYHFDHLDLRNAVVPWTMPSASHHANTNAIGIMACQCWCKWHDMTKQSHVAPHFNCLELRNSVVAFSILVVPCDAKANSITWQKSHVLPCFNHLDLVNNLVPLPVPLMLKDGCTFAKSTISPKESFIPCFFCLLMNKMMPLVVQLASCNSNVGTKWPTEMS